MAWREFNQKDISFTLSRTETEVYSRSAGGADAADAMIEAIAKKTASLVRGYLSAAGYALPPEESFLPESLIPPACDYAVFDVLKSLPLKISDARTKARTDALAIFQSVAAGKFKPEIYAETDATSSVAPMPSFSSEKVRILD